MFLLNAFVTATFLATAVYHMVARDTDRRMQAETDDLSRSNGPEPSVAATFAFFLGITAPYFLYRSRGVVGFFQGIGLLVLAGALHVGVSVALVLLTR